MEELYEICKQCKREVPTSNMTIHLLRCVRNVDCTVCDETVPAQLIAKHMLIHNKPVPCPNCNKQVPQKDLDDHIHTKCEERKVQCEYCEIDLREPDMKDHQLYCGARTEQCPECNEYVMFKYKQLHLDSNHTFIKLDDEPGPTASWNKKKDAFDDVYKNNSPQYFLPGANVSRQYVDGGSDFVFLNESNHRNENIFQRSHSSAEAIAERATTSLRAISSALEDLRANDVSNMLRRSRDAGGSGNVRGTGAVRKGNYNKGKAPQPPAQGEEAMLPCETCNAQFPMSLLVQHESVCRFRLDYTSNFETDDEEPAALKVFANSRPTANEITLPCEFCCDMYPASQLLSHQNGCDLKDLS